MSRKPADTKKARLENRASAKRQTGWSAVRNGALMTVALVGLLAALYMAAEFGRMTGVTSSVHS